MENFTAVAKGIISNAIRSVIFVDDELARPFDSEPNHNERELAKGLYDSFLSNNCGLNFHRYESQELWENKIGYFFKGRDLFITDWQLEKTGIEYAPTISILKRALQSPSLHFICIYTTTPREDFQNIIYQLNASFGSHASSKSKDSLSALEDWLEEEGFDSDQILDEEFKSLCKELVLYPQKAKTILQNIQSILTDKINKDNLKGFFDVLDYSNRTAACHAIGYQLNNSVFDDDVQNFEITNHTEKNFLIVNNTIILILNKIDIGPSLLYDSFSDAIIDSSGNFLTLLALEMRNLLRDSSAFIGKDIDNINELAFFYHQEQSTPGEAFDDFLADLWKSQATSFLYNKETQPKLLAQLATYKVSKGIEEKLKTYSGTKRDYDLAKLNYYYNILFTNRKDHDQLRFGDVFNILSPDGTSSKKYLLSITAHSDSLRPSKVKNMFFFVEGIENTLPSALGKGDEGYFSYLLKEDMVKATSWDHKPFTVYIASASNDIQQQIEVSFGGETFRIQHFATLKPNYAQRIANHAFAHPSRVGIYFADTKAV